MAETELVSYAEAADLLRVPKTTLIWLVGRDRLEVFRAAYGVQRRRYLRRADVERLRQGDGWRRRQPPMKGGSR